MSKKSAKIAALIESCAGQKLDRHYLGYFHCFNQQLYFEAHDVLEELWLTDRHGPNGAYYKGLIQLAGAFVHIQKNRVGPAIALFKLALGNLLLYPDGHEELDLVSVRHLIREWITRLDGRQTTAGLLDAQSAPVLQLRDAPAQETARERI